MKKWQKVTNAKEQREHERKRVFIRATMVTAAGSVRAFVRNLSCGGALLDCNAAARKGDRVELRCDDLVAAATIAWMHDKQIGLQFAEPLPADYIMARLDEASPGSKRGPRRHPLPPPAHPTGLSTERHLTPGSDGA